MIKINTDNLAIWTDYHIGIKQNNEQKLEIAEKYIDWFILKCINNKVDKVVFLGDFFHTRNTINVNILNKSYEILKKLTDNFEVFLIIGNHDIFYKQQMNVHSLKGFSDIPNLHLIENTTEILINEKKTGLMCPFHWEVPKNKKYDYMFGHFEMSGAKLAGSLSIDKMPMQKLLDYAPLVFSGHYHISKEYLFETGKVITVGSTFEQDWGDFNNEKGFYILDGKTFKYKKIINDFSPKHKKIFWSNILDNLSEFNGCFVKVVVDCPYTFDKLNELVLKLKTTGAINVEVDFLYNVEDFASSDNTISQKKSYTKFEYIKNYIDDMSNIEGVEKSEILKQMTEYFQKAESESNKILSLNANDIKFNSISIQNFKSIGEKIKMNYDDYHGVWYVKGENLDTGDSVGAGKTSIISAIVFALFGKDLKNTKNKYIFNRLMNIKLQTEVELLFTINNIEYKIKTHFNPKNPTTHMSLYKFDDNWIDISKSSIVETKKYIEHTLLKCSYDLFKSSIYLCGQDYKSFFTLNKGKKRNFLEDIFNLSIFGEILILIRKDYNKLNNEINTLESNVNYNKKMLIDLIKQNKNFEQNKKAEIEKINLERDLNTVEYDKSINIDLNIKIAKLNEKLIKYDLIKDNILKLKKQKAELSNTIIQTEAETKYLKKNNLKYTKTLVKLCKNCSNIISEKFNINKNNIEIETKNKDIAQYKMKVDVIDVNLNKLQNVFKKLNVILKKVNEIKIENKYKKQNETRLKDISAKLEIRLKDIINKDNSLVEMIENSKKDLNKNMNTISEYYKKLKILDILSAIANEDGVKTYIIHDLIQVLNKLMRRYLDQMGTEFNISFKNNFDVTFLTSSGECSFENFSGGEKKCIEVAAMFSFRRLLWADGIRTNLTVLDEVMDAGISSQYCQLFLDIIKKESEKDFNSSGIKTTTFIISHKNFNPEDFDGTLIVRKTAGISKII